MIDPQQFRMLVVRPTLEQLGLWSLVAQELVLGTALVESRLRWLRQVGGGPALGVYQIEPATHADIWRNFLLFRPLLAASIAQLLAPQPTREDQLVTNLAYATAICRVHYYRVPELLPETIDPDALGAYWKAHYNTAKGAGRAEDFAACYRPWVAA